MCGINLTFGEDEIRQMNRALWHRGYRLNHKKLKNNLYLGHVRLPIQGLDPINDHPITDGRYTTAMVGEIFNYKELDPTANSDLPVFLKYYKEEGVDCFKRFDGFWSIIIYDAHTRETHAFTDFLAKKPLYIRREPFPAISSEIKALSLLGKNTFDETYFSAVAKWGYCPEGRTPFNEIIKIPAGAHVIIDRWGEITHTIYTELKPRKTSINCLRKAVKNRIVSDVPISILMSGGLDSTIIYYLMREFVDEMTIFHIDNKEAEYLNYIDFRPGDKVIELSLGKGNTNFDMDQVLYYNEGPVDLGSMIPQYLLSEAIRKQGFNVCLSGDGADELFGGYKRINDYDSQYSDIFHELVFYHLPRLDKLMMANTVELRCPFLARGVLEYAMALPYEQRLNKIALKQAFRGVVPKEIIERKKQPLRYRVDWRHDLIESYRDLMKRSNLV